MFLRCIRMGVGESKLFADMMNGRFCCASVRHITQVGNRAVSSKTGPPFKVGPVRSQIEMRRQRQP